MWTHNVFELVAALTVGGVVCGVLWEFFRIQRILLGIGEQIKISSCKRDIVKLLFVFVQDVSFFVAAACVLAVAYYYGNNGNFRIFALFFAALGAFVYLKTAGRLTERAAIGLRRLFVGFKARLAKAIKRVVDNIKCKKIKLKSKVALGLEKHRRHKPLENKG